MRLYELADEIVEIERMIEDNGGEVTDEIMCYLEDSCLQFDEKAVQTGTLIKSWCNNINAVDSEITRLKRLKEIEQKKIDRLKTYLIQNLQVIGKDKIQDNRCNIRLGKSYSTLINDKDLIPSDYLRTKQIIEPDKDKIKKDLKDGIEIAGTTLQEKNFLTIT